ncbi:uncharacterized protein BcabD6B2_43070 [Babesia caballi]|uniref:Uncharacterized protein n=1 Tax=Babesia caballi TaxID=5871 RepID=A0AAV4LZ24_BABCB|nr:hypothetical protein, conserved [Babesia caballi]
MGVLKKNSLTEWPEDLKDVIDWFLRVGGKDFKTQLQSAIEKLASFTEATKGLGTFHIEGLFDSVTKALQHLIGYDGMYQLYDKGIALQSGYTSSYGSAKWDGDSKNTQTCALIFLGTVPIVYLVMSYIYWRCSESHGKGDWCTHNINGVSQALVQFMSAMGFTSTQLSESMMGNKVAKLLAEEGIHCFSELTKAQKSTYDAFLKNLEQNAIGSAINHPLASCHKLATAYFESQKTNASEVTDAINKLKTKFEEFSQNSEITQSTALMPNPYEPLKELITQLLSAVQKFQPKEPEQFGQGVHHGVNEGGAPTPQPSPAGPVAGTLTTPGLGGGAAAAYLFNFGGAKTLVNGLLRIDTHSSAPADLSFGCSSNLKEAIDWILRVTGKDGQTTGGDGTQQLATAVAELLGGVQSSSSELQKKFQEIKNALNSGSGTGLIAKLADGLQQFIGYKDNNKNGLIGVDGIAVSNDPLERLRDGVLGFWIGVLGELKRYNAALQLNMNDKEVGDAIETCNAAVGGGLSIFDAAVKKVKPVIENVDGQSIREFVSKLKIVNDFQSQNGLKGFASNVEEYLKAVLEAVKTKASSISEVDTLKSKLETLLTKLKKLEANTPLDVTSGATNGIKNEIGNVNSGSVSLKSKIANVNDSAAYALVEIVIAGTNGFLWQLRRKYASLYQGSQWPTTHNDPQTCTKIFLSCVPFIWSALSYLCWRCNLVSDQGGFKDLTLSGGDAKEFMFTMGYTNLNQISGQKMGSDVFATAMKGFKDFKEGMDSAGSKARGRASKLHGSSQTTTFPEFLHELEKQVTRISTSIGSSAQNNFMSLSYLLAKCYFKGVHLTSLQSRGRPSTIREMLYWIAGLPFAPGYESLKAHISGIFKDVLGNHTAADPSKLRLPVAVSGSSRKGDFISPASVTTYLTTTACTIPNTLAFLQGRSDASGPLLHSVFSNSMKFKYPASGAALFSELCDYAYALKSHLSFLHQQCKGKYSEGFGWRHCKYGRTVNNVMPNGDSAPAWICTVYQCTDAATCYHNGKSGSAANECYHNDATKTKGCGDPQGKPSPLQGFLTDNLKGFRLNSSDSISTHLDNHSPGSMCHVKMGFTADALLNATLMGFYLHHPLNFLSGNPNTPLPQLCDQLTCLSRRTPRNLSDLFGFYWHMVGQLFSDELIIHDLKSVIKQNPYSVEDFITMFKTKLRSRRSTRASAPEKSGFVKFLESMGQTIPFLYQLFTFDESKFLPDLIFDLAQHCHRRHVGSNGTSVTHTNPSGKSCSNPNDLWSLYQPVSNTGNMSDCKSGTCGGYLRPLTHALGSAFAPKHASTYLSWFLYLTEDLQEWLNELKRQFQQLKCVNCSTCSNQGNCHGGPTQQCSCPSVVQCSGVLPILYANGFSFHNAYSLKGGMKGSDQTKRTCKKFHDQLSAVLVQNERTPLFKLLLTIDEFLYLFRFYFFYNLSTFWIIYVCIVLHIYFLRADLLHVKSHVHLPSSHGIPPIGLLTTGKQLPMTKLTYITP